MVHYIQIHVRLFVFVTVLLCLLNFGCPLTAPAQTQRGPSDVVREFYKDVRDVPVDLLARDFNLLRNLCGSFFKVRSQVFHFLSR